MAGRLTLDLVGPKEIAEMFGIHQVSVSRWRRLGKLPEPDFELSRRPLWLRSNIEQWAEKTGRRIVA